MKKWVASSLFFAAAVVGLLALSATPGDAAPPCPDTGIYCLDVFDPVVCLKPGQGWRTYSNLCYAHRDCAKRCQPAGSLQ